MSSSATVDTPSSKIEESDVATPLCKETTIEPTCTPQEKETVTDTKGAHGDVLLAMKEESDDDTL